MPVVLIGAGYLFISTIALRSYLQPGSLSFVLGVFTLSFVFRTSERAERSYRFGWICCLFIILGFLLPVKTILFFTLSLALLFLSESVYGKTGLLPLFVFILMSPAVQYLADVFSFPIRLQLTQFAGNIFNFFSVGTIVKGNMIIQGSREFSVDPGCMGLNMIEASLMLSIMLILASERQYKKRARGMIMLFYFILVVLLNILANLFRIVILVQLNIPPGSVFHDVSGILCLLAYVFIPCIYFSGFLIRRTGKPVVGYPQILNISRRDIVLHVLLLFGISLLSIYVMNADTYKKVRLSAIGSICDYSTTLYTPGIVKLQNKEALIYIKYIRGFYDTDHNPMICWKGSGYLFEQVQKNKITGGDIYTGTLVNGTNTLYSAWWYSNGETVITDQWTWRWDMLKGKKPYALINLTCSNKVELDRRIKAITQQRIFSPFFSRKVYR